MAAVRLRWELAALKEGGEREEMKVRMIETEDECKTNANVGGKRRKYMNVICFNTRT